MSCSKWRYTPACDDHMDECVGDCDLCSFEPVEMTREEAIEKLKVFAPMVVDDTREALDMAIEALDRQKGEWEYHNYSDISNKYQGYFICSVCGYHEHTKHYFCPNCGADMRGDTE